VPIVSSFFKFNKYIIVRNILSPLVFVFGARKTIRTSTKISVGETLTLSPKEVHKTQIMVQKSVCALSHSFIFTNKMISNSKCDAPI
jgi:hypothetical protein